MHNYLLAKSSGNEPQRESRGDIGFEIQRWVWPHFSAPDVQPLFATPFGMTFNRRCFHLVHLNWKYWGGDASRIKWEVFWHNEVTLNKKSKVVTWINYTSKGLLLFLPHRPVLIWKITNIGSNPPLRIDTLRKDHGNTSELQTPSFVSPHETCAYLVRNEFHKHQKIWLAFSFFDL